MAPSIGTFTSFSCPAFSFLIEHPSSGRSLLFDLGVRKDWQNYSAPIRNRIRDGGWSVTAKQGAREQLEEHGVDVTKIEAVIWSHWHWDQVGDPLTFEKSTALIVGSGFKDAFIPGYLANPESPILESDYADRELREISFEEEKAEKIGRFNALDYLGDGSFYLLDSPGHAIGHMCGLARVSSSPNPFVFMGGDAFHHAGEFRPTKYLPIPESILPNLFDKHSKNPCPGSLFNDLYRDGDSKKPFFGIARLDDGKGVAHDADQAEETIRKVEEADMHMMRR